MQHIILLFCACFLLLTSSPGQASKASDIITLNLPESVLAEAVSKSLPLEVDASSKRLQGNIVIKNISDLKLTDQHLACRLHLAGNQLHFITEVAGHEIRVKVGEVDVDFKANVKLRFDSKKQTLFITPIIDKVNASTDSSGGDIGHALVSLLNGKEFPLRVQDIDPLIAKTGAKTLTIMTKITDIRAQEKRLQFSLEPHITAE